MDPKIVADLPPELDAKDDAGTPRWVYVFGIIAIVVVALFVVLHLSTGGLGYHLRTP